MGGDWLFVFLRKNGEKNGDLILKNTEAIAFNYRIYVHTANVSEAHVADQYTQFTTPAKATVQ